MNPDHPSDAAAPAADSPTKPLGDRSADHPGGPTGGAGGGVARERIDPSGFRTARRRHLFVVRGLRRAEITHLTAAVIDFAGGTVCVRYGKGRKDRIVPIGDRALMWLGKYLAEARPKLAKPGDDHGPLFVTERGGPFTEKHLSAHITRYVLASGVGKAGSCHIFRHTCATVMLEHGADIRHVQEQLGHACLQTTQIYTHVSIRKLKEVHSLTHPGASLAPRPAERGTS